METHTKTRTLTIAEALALALRSNITGPFYQGRANQPKARRLAEEEAGAAGLKGDLRKLFVRQRETGRVAAGQIENVTEQGLMDELLTPLTFLGIAVGLGPSGTAALGLHPAGAKPYFPHGNAPGAGSTKTHYAPTTPGQAEGREPGSSGLESQNEPGIGERTQEAAGSLVREVEALISGYGVRLLEIIAGGALVLFGLVMLGRHSAGEIARKVA